MITAEILRCPFDPFGSVYPERSRMGSGQALSNLLPAPNDGRILSFDYTQDRFGAGQAGQALWLRLGPLAASEAYGGAGSPRRAPRRV